MAHILLLCFILLQTSLFLATAREIKEANAPVTRVEFEVEFQARPNVGNIAESPNASSEEGVESKTETPETAEGPGDERSKPVHHHPSGEFAGGGVILGGLATAFFAAVFCYIRVTRKQNTEEDIKITVNHSKPESPGNYLRSPAIPAP